MKKKIMKSLALMLTLVIIAANSGNVMVSANEENSMLNAEEYEQICKQLYFISGNEKTLQLVSTNASVYYIGEPIYSYEYTNGSLIELDYLTYPIYSGDEIISLALKVDLENGISNVQITECFIDKFCHYDASNEAIALIYDRNNTYIMTENRIEIIGTYAEPMEHRDLFAGTVKNNDVILNEVKKVEPISAQENQIQTCASNAYTASLSVAFVSQNPPSNICWAAATACIGNFLTGDNKTADDIAKSVYGTVYWDRMASLADSISALNANYSEEYSVYQYWSAPTDVAIYANLAIGYPLYGRMEIVGVTNGYHQVVIRGILENSYILIMDPQFGFTTAWKANGEYSYINSYNGYTHKLIGYASKG